MATYDSENLPDLPSESAPPPFPDLATLIHPGSWVAWSFTFLDGWLFSRPFRRLWAGLPVVLMCVAGGVLWGIGDPAKSDRVVDLYREKILTAELQGRPEDAALLARALERLRPEDPQIVFAAALSIVEQAPEEAVSRIQALAPSEGPGFSAARIWLVKESNKSKGAVKLTDSECKVQLKKVLEVSPTNEEAKWLLAGLYIKNEEWQQAEPLLGSLTAYHPELTLQFALVKEKLGRPTQDIASLLKEAEVSLRERLSQRPDESSLWIQLAEVLIRQRRTEESRNILLKELQRNDTPEMRRRIAILDLSESRMIAASSAVGLDVAVRHCARAAEVDPGCLDILTQLISLQGRGAQISSEVVKPAVSWWTEQLQLHPDNTEIRLVCGQYLSLAGEPSAAADVLLQAVESRPDLRLPVVELLKSAGRASEADDLLGQEVAEAKTAFEREPLPIHRIRLARSLMMSGKADEVYGLTEASQKLPPSGGSQEEVSLQQIFGTSCLARFDQLRASLTSTMSWPEDAKSNLMTWLDQASRIPGSSVGALQRLSTLAFSDTPVSQTALESIRRLRLSGSDPDVLSLIGSMALLAGKPDEAVAFFTLAEAGSRGQNPAVLNNLALAKLRAGKSDLTEVLAISEKALSAAPDQPDFHSTRAEIYVAMKEWDKALADLKECLPYRTNSPAVHELMSQVLSELGDAEMAKAHADQAKTLKERRK